MAAYELKSLRDVLGERGYIRGPFGSALVRGELQSEGVPVYEQQHAITGTRRFRFFVSDQKFKELSRFQVRPNDLIISCSGTVGRISVIQPNDPMGIISQALLILRPHSRDVLPEFLFYFLSTSKGRHSLVQASHGSVQVNIAPRAVVEQIELPVPTLDEQRAIAHILGTLDDKIELNRRMNETLEAMARTLFKSWFGGFDPVRATVAELIRDHVLEIGDGYRAKNSELGESGLPFIRAGNLNNGFDTAGADLLREESVSKAGSKVCRLGDVAFTSKGTIGRFARVTEHTARFVYSPQVCYWRSLNPARLHPVMLYCWMQSDELREQIAAVAGKTDMAPYVSLQDQRLMSIPGFPLSQHTVARRIEPLLARQSSNAAEANTLATLRGTLLPKLISGEVRVKDAADLIQETTV